MAEEPSTTTQNGGGSSVQNSLFSLPQISLPKGGGAIRGIDEKFTANAATGTGSLSVPIALSPGRSGFGPQLNLSYNSGAGNGSAGLGWSFSLPVITFNTGKEIPCYSDGDDAHSPIAGEYTVEVVFRGFCSVHRPPFHVRNGEPLEFDCLLVDCPTVDSSSNVLIPERTYQEQSLGQHGNVIVASGPRKELAERIKYGSISSAHYPDKHAPVTIRFGTYTVQAEAVTLDEKTKALKAEGYVSIQDGRADASHTERCVVIHTANVEPL